MWILIRVFCKHNLSWYSTISGAANTLKFTIENKRAKWLRMNEREWMAASRCELDKDEDEDEQDAKECVPGRRRIEYLRFRPESTDDRDGERVRREGPWKSEKIG